LKDARGDARLLVRIGELEAISPEALRASFEEQARGTSAMGTHLMVESILASLRCEGCGHETPLRDVRDAVRCGQCGNESLRPEGRGWSVSILHGDP
jgi:hydrogenase nickel incorporation protein HypA/HybF